MRPMLVEQYLDDGVQHAKAGGNLTGCFLANVLPRQGFIWGNWVGGGGGGNRMYTPTYSGHTHI